MVDKPEMVFAGGRKMDCILIAGDGHQSTYNNGIYIYIPIMFELPLWDHVLPVAHMMIDDITMMNGW